MSYEQLVKYIGDEEYSGFGFCNFEFFIFALSLILAILILLFGPKNNNTYSEVILSDDNIDFLPDEKIIENKRQCTEIGISIGGYYRRKRDIIVTNKRIILGNLDTLTLYSKGNLKQDMTIFNLWSNKIEKIPILKNSKFLYNLLGANTKINDIAYGEEKNKGKFFIIRNNYGVVKYLKIYHPQADIIYNTFK